MTKRRWWVRHPKSGWYLGFNDGYIWVKMDSSHSLSLTEKQIKSINPKFWEWRVEDNTYFI